MCEIPRIARLPIYNGFQDPGQKLLAPYLSTEIRKVCKALERELTMLRIITGPLYCNTVFTVWTCYVAIEC